MTPTAIAAKLRQHSPGCLPESLTFDSEGAWYDIGDDRPLVIPDDIAEAVLRDAMTEDIAPHATLIRTADAYMLDVMDGSRDKWFHDCDHGGSLGACYAAWCWAKGLPHE